MSFAGQLIQRTAREHTALLGLGTYRPRRVVSNDEIAGPIDSSDEWIRTRSGIESRRFAGPDETLESMSIAAGSAALAYAGIEAQQVDCVIVATSTRTVYTPALAPAVATALGMESAAGFDLAAGCAGFCHALGVASDLVRGGTARHVLVIGAERLSNNVDMTDRSTAFLFADGAGAVLVGPAAQAGIGPTVWGSDGSRAHAIRQDKDWDTFMAEVAEGGRDRPYMALEGAEVFRWATSSLEKLCREALESASVDVADLDALIPHQANGRITEVLTAVLGVGAECAVADDIKVAGNTSAASVPLAMKALLDQGRVAPGDLALLVAFGAGLSYAAQVVRLPAARAAA